MHGPTTRSVEYWQRLERIVTAKADAAMGRDESARERLVPHLRGLERTARAERANAQTIQIIASARRVLGDASALGPIEWPSARPPGAAP